MNTNDTITAISTPQGEGAIGIVRISGLSSKQIFQRLFVPKKTNNADLFLPYKARNGYIINPDDASKIDEVISLFMPSTHSYTCEDIIEIHCHGGIFLVRKILELVLKQGARLAEPGEFTKRAFLNGRIDLSQAEAVIDLIKADSDASAKAALIMLEGRILSKIESIVTILIGISASIEASIDFPDEDIDTSSYSVIQENLAFAIARIDTLITGFYKGRILRNGISLVIAGRPNVGKSSLINALLTEDRVIVSTEPGTTRDIIEESIVINGISCKIKDTAGLRKTDLAVEEEGIRRTKTAMGEADIILFMICADEGITKEDRDAFAQVDKEKTIVIANKTDLPNTLSCEETKKIFRTETVIKISAKKETGLNRLQSEVGKKIAVDTSCLETASVITKARHHDLLIQTKKALQEAEKTVKGDQSEEFIAVDINSALHSLEEIIGRKVSEDILHTIFSEFCIGK